MIVRHTSCFQGFSVKKQLHSISLYTNNEELRDFVVSGQETRLLLLLMVSLCLSGCLNV